MLLNDTHLVSYSLYGSKNLAPLVDNSGQYTLRSCGKSTPFLGSCTFSKKSSYTVVFLVIL